MFSKPSVVATSILVTVARLPPTAGAVAGVLGLLIKDLNVPVGLNGSPITVIGNNCSGTSVTCNAPEKEWGGLIALNCIPITL
ncbi:hypothetical protein B0H10DRAFT_2221853 [Mycena sp. CBHHK59/15]|nr:hypothetical protein B0H10DRAFT_2221853 [Mycena sp. CBHHK59/15]